MKKIITMLAGAGLILSLTACGNQQNSDSNQSQATENSQTSTKAQSSHHTNNSSKTNQNSQNQSLTSSTSQSSQAKTMTTSQVIARVAQLKNVNLNGGDKIYVTPTGTPNVFKIYIKGANQDPQVDSIVDHYVYNGNTDVLSQATDR
ncbi:hypothetical protein [uncultured Limosilactobacillus sp.]|uniref:hypothetical protein n=1 Tax=uncultured Limosilactobacillus sp. TaxID=2837629 RepID=UPI0025E73792|nr:hypothetical protein [uncultured Limosilactobacillus sp.]